MAVAVVADVRRLNEGRRNEAVNKSLQNFMYSMLTDENPIAAKMSLDVMIELHHKKVGFIFWVNLLLGVSFGFKVFHLESFSVL